MDKRGAVMALSLGLMAFITTLGAAFMIHSLNEDRLGLQDASRQTAFYLAEAAVDQASMNLRTPTDPTDDILTAALPTGTFLVDAPVLLGVNLWQVTAHGTSGNAQRAIEVVYQLTPQSVFQYAVFADRQLTVGGSAITDSYNSNLGPYQDDPTKPGYNAGHDGDIGTNSTTANGVNISGSIFVDGQVVVGPNVANPISVVTGYNPAFITGGTSPPSDDQDVVSGPATFPMPAVTVPNGLTCNDYTVSASSTVTLLPGTYCYHNLTIQGSGTLTTNGTGTVTVYLTGALIARGNSTVGYASSPSKMMFLMSGGTQATLEQGDITGSTNFYGALYGPLATINVSGNANVFGAIIAKDVKLNGSAELHYDEALQQVSSVSNLSQRTVVSWRDLN